VVARLPAGNFSSGFPGESSVAIKTAAGARWWNASMLRGGVEATDGVRE
jgi:hypothetical protein